MGKLFITIIVLALIITNSLTAEEMVQVRQRIGQESLVGLYHNEPYLGLEFLYNNKPKMTLGVGPRYAITRKGITFNTFGYLAVIANPAKPKWSAEEAEADTFLTFRSGKWAGLARTKFKKNLTDTTPKKYYWGEDWLGYQITQTLQIQARTEWMHKSGKLTQSIGCGWSKKLSPVLKFNGYLALDTKTRNKVGWMEMMMVK